VSSFEQNSNALSLSNAGCNFAGANCCTVAQYMVARLLTGKYAGVMLNYEGWGPLLRAPRLLAQTIRFSYY
jgi:hypothetical protein